MIKLWRIRQATRRTQHAAASPGVLAAGSLAALVVLMVLGLMLLGGRPEAQVTLRFRCAAGLQPPIERAVAEYQQQHPQVRIEVDYQGSGTLLESIRVESARGMPRSDLYLAADASYIERGREQGLLGEALPVASQRPVIAVRPGNPKNIHSLADLTQGDVVYAIADPDGAAIGQVTRQFAQQQGLWAALDRNKKAQVTQVPELIALMKSGGLYDAVIIWDANCAQHNALQAIRLGDGSAGSSDILVAVVANTDHQDTAIDLARFLASPETGGRHFMAAHYQPPGD